MALQDLQQMFKQRYDRQNWRHFLSDSFAGAKLFDHPEILTGIDINVAASACRLGYIALDENGIERQIAVYEVTLATGIILERNRVGLRNLLRKYWRDIDAAFIAYHRPESGKWRFSYVSELTGFDGDGEFVKIKTEPKRYTYILGEGESTKTACDRFKLIAAKGRKISLDDVKEAFSVEKLSKIFFDEYKKHYEAFCRYMIQEKGILLTLFNGDEKAIRDFNKKLLGRIVFLYFIQKKGWLGVPVDGKWGEGDINFLTNLFEGYDSKALFYQELLSKLFFETLNKKRDRDLVEINGKRYRIPYLNGGLFEEDKHRNLVFPEQLFENLFYFFNQYNFTVYEDDPNDHTVAVDPEMLGHIFENLLEDNKDKGAFYTPKEIVHYMCQESLIEYLTTWFENDGYVVVGYISIDKPEQPSLFSENTVRETQLKLEMPMQAVSGTKQINRVLIEKLLKKTLSDDEKLLVKGYADKFNEALDAVKICDPAIGSGAFPMGLLHEIFTAKQTLYGIVYGNANGFAASEVKLNIIQNSIYGVDIERGAVDIARLRFWLSLIVDEVEPKPLPNLDYKIVVGNSLVSKLDDQVIDLDWGMKGTKQTNILYDVSKPERILRSISEKQREFFSPNSNKKQLSSEIRDLKIDLLISQLELMVKDRGLEAAPVGVGKKLAEETKRHLQTLGWKGTIAQLRKLRAKPDGVLNFFDWKLDFPEVMNPYLFEENSPEIKTANKQIDSLNAQIDSVNLHLSQNEINLHLIHLQANIAQSQIAIIKQQLLEIESQINVMYSKLSNIDNHIVKELDLSFTYNIQSINKSIDEINKKIKLINPQIEKQNPSLGFDILIGNPPYVQLQKENGKLADIYKNCDFETFERTGDIYSLFYEQGIIMLKTGGNLNFITSNKWMRANYGKSTRAFFCKYNPLKIIDLGSGIFETATVDTNIIIIQKPKNPVTKFELKALNLSKVKKIISFENFADQWVVLNNLDDSTWTILDPIQKNIKRKIERIGKPLKDLDVNIYRGILTGFNDAFIIDTETKERICKEDPKSTEIIKPILRGKDIKRYKAEWAGLWLINTHNGYKDEQGKKIEPIKISNYPAIKKHLDQFYPQLEKRTDKGVTPYNLRNCAYLKEFEKQKLIYPNMTLFLPFVFDGNNFYTNQKCYIITSKTLNLKFANAYLSSKLAAKWLRENCPELQGGTRELSKVFFENIPIPQFSQVIESLFVKKLDKILSLKSEGKDTTALEQQIDNLVYKLYELTYQEIKAIDSEFKLTESEYEAIKIE